MHEHLYRHVRGLGKKRVKQIVYNAVDFDFRGYTMYHNILLVVGNKVYSELVEEMSSIHCYQISLPIHC